MDEEELGLEFEQDFCIAINMMPENGSKKPTQNNS